VSLNKQLEELIKDLMDETNSTGDGEAYNTPNAFGELDDDEIEKSGYEKVEESTFIKASKIMLGETSYRAYRKDESATPKQKVNRAIREIGGKLKEIDKILTNNIKLKTETGVDRGKYWKSTRKTLHKIAERMSGISEKLRRF
jgi:hypothetical protein